MRPDGPVRCFGRFTSEKRARGWIVTHEKQGYERIHGREMGEAAIESDGTNVFVIYDGKRIAKRGHPDTPQAGTWVSIEPGYTVWDKNYPQELVIEYEG
jgi:hypothetical protein